MSISKEDLKTVMGANLRRLRTARYLSLGELAYIMKITPGFLGLIERGRRGLTAHMLMTAARVFEVSVNFFFESDLAENGDGNYAAEDYDAEEDGIVIFMPVIVYPRKYKDKLQEVIRKLKGCSVFNGERKLKLLEELLTEPGKMPVDGS